MKLKYKDITDLILKSFYDVYNELGYGFLESVYENALAIELKEKGLKVETQKPITVNYKNEIVGDFRSDILVNNLVILELKAVRSILPEHEAQIINYLRATDIEVGLIINFGKKAEFKRFVFENNRKNNPRLSVVISGQQKE